MKLLRISIALLVALSLAACGDSTKVGSELDRDALAGEQGRLGEKEMEALKKQGGDAAALPAGGEGEAAQGDDGAGEAASEQEAERKQEEQVQKAKEDAAVQVQIRDEGFVDSVITVYEGGTVNFTNVTNKVASVEADNNEFASPAIQPGASWLYTAGEAGEYNFHDGERPYVVGKLIVARR